MQNDVTRKRGFTLIELLVVISIIALLIGILLPALGRARESSRKGVCLAQQRQAGIGFYTYAAEWSDWLPGPNTSGYDLMQGGAQGGSPDSPVQNVDWISPILGLALNLPGKQPGDGLGQIPEKHLRVMFETAFRCPANNVTYDYAYAGSDELDGVPVTELPTASYSSPIAFHYWSQGDSRMLNEDDWDGFPVHLVGYRPNLSRVGRADGKVATLDGTRYVTNDTFEVSFNWIKNQIRGGNFMVAGPTTADNSSGGGDPQTLAKDNLNFTLAEQDAIRRFAYRHDDGLVASFFDGHAEWLTEEQTRNAHLWYPSGSIVKGQLLDPNAPREIH